MVLVVVSPVSFIWVLSLFFLVSLARSFSILFTLSKPALDFVDFFYYFLISILFISSLIIIIPFLLLAFGFVLLLILVHGKLGCLFLEKDLCRCELPSQNCFWFVFFFSFKHLKDFVKLYFHFYLSLDIF